MQAWQLKRCLSVFNRAASRPHRPRSAAIRRLMRLAGIPVPEEVRRARQIGEASSSSELSDSEDSSSSDGEGSDNDPGVASDPGPTPVESGEVPSAEVAMDEEPHPPVLPREVPVQEHARPAGESRVHVDDGVGPSSSSGRAASSSDYEATSAPSIYGGPPKFTDYFFW